METSLNSSAKLLEAQIVPVMVDFDSEIIDLIKKLELNERAIDRKIFTEITSPQKGKGQFLLNLHLLELVRSASIEEINQELKKHNLIHGGHIELLNLGINYPYLHENSTTITALGSFVTPWESKWNSNGTRYYYSLIGKNCSSHHYPRRLHLLLKNGSWPKGYKILAVPQEGIKQFYV